MTNRELGIKIGNLAAEERKITGEILRLINLSFDRRAYLEHGYSSMYLWLVKGFGYSEGAASRRIKSAQMIRNVPGALEKLESGDVSLTTLSLAQRAIQIQEKASGQKVDAAEIVRKIENKSIEEAQQILMHELPENKSHVHQERKTVIDDNTIRHSINFTKEMEADLKRAKEVLSHQLPNGSDAEVLAYALKLLLEKKDPLVTSAAEKRRVKAGKITLRSTGGTCCFKDEVTGQVCGSRYQIQRDHIMPKGLGGSDEQYNRRPLCRQHNLFMAEKYYGKLHMDQFRRTPD
jgi:hypothetical protein